MLPTPVMSLNIIWAVLTLNVVRVHVVGTAQFPCGCEDGNPCLFGFFSLPTLLHYQ
jgi:hypothetical protein